MIERVAVIGLGYVGLPLALAASKIGYSVVGVEANKQKAEEINQGISPIVDVTNAEIQYSLSLKNFYATSDDSKIAGSQIIILCVPTPASADSKPDLTFLTDAAYSVGKYLSKGCLVILESTVEPGTTLNHLVPILLQESKLTLQDFHVVYSPERIDPSNNKWNLNNIPKLVAGLNQLATNKAVYFYSKFLESVVECESIEIAECAKLLENSFRYVNISFINEFSIFCNKLGVDVNKVIAAAATKPYGFMPFHPSIGVGGHCIPVDPLYLANKANKIGAPIRSIELAHQINKEMPIYFVKETERKIGNLKGKKILVVGVSYKPNVSDVRESAVEALILSLRKKGAIVNWHDDLVKKWKSEQSVPLDSGYDLVILASLHSYVDLDLLGNVPILDTKGSVF